MGNDVPIFTFCRKQFKQINSSVILWEGFNLNSNDPYISIFKAEACDTFPFYNKEALDTFHFNLDSMFCKMENDFSAFRKMFNFTVKIDVSRKQNNFEVRSDNFIIEKDKLHLEITGLTGNNYYSEIIDFNQKYSIPIPTEEKIVVYRISYDGMLMESKKIAK